MNRNTKRFVCVLMALSMTASLSAQAVTIPAGTPVYAELEETITSKKKDATEGQIVPAHVWRDVVVDGQVVIKAGAPLVTKILDAKRAKVLGRKGELELEAVSVQAADGTEVPLQGGYDKSGKGRVGITVGLTALVAWPLFLIKGKQAELPAGTIFDATVAGNTEVPGVQSAAEVAADAAAAAPATTTFNVDVLYDDIQTEGELKTMSFNIRNCSGPVETAQIVSLNGAPLSPPLVLQLEPSQQVDGCYVSRGTVDLAALAKNFRVGINRFEIEGGGAKAEVVLDIEL